MIAGEHEELAITSWHVRASVAQAREDPSTTELLYRQILDRDPRDLRALNNLADSLVQLGRCEQAATLSARALALQPRNPHVLDTHAQAMVCRGDFVEAETAIRMALSSRPDNPAMVLTLVRILTAQSRLAQAQDELDRAEALLRTRGQTTGSSWADLDALREQLGQKSSRSVQ